METPPLLDKIDKAILDMLQTDATASLVQIGARVQLSATPCWRRIRRLEREGYIRQRVALLDRVKLNVGVTVFVAVRTRQHNAQWDARFAAVAMAIPQIVDIYRMSGAVDYLLRVVVPDIRGYDAVYQRLVREIDLTEVRSSFAIEQIKSTTAVPLDYV